MGRRDVLPRLWKYATDDNYNHEHNDHDHNDSGRRTSAHATVLAAAVSLPRAPTATPGEAVVVVAAKGNER